ncbi:unnamed protein product [Trichobilharzia regenti]|nr:unnamed protein product [Trichobilharzia regenti]
MADDEEIRESTVLKAQEEEYEQASMASIHLQSEVLLPQESVRQSQLSNEDELIDGVEGEEQIERGEGEEGGDDEEEGEKKVTEVRGKKFLCFTIYYCCSFGFQVEHMA